MTPDPQHGVSAANLRRRLRMAEVFIVTTSFRQTRFQLAVRKRALRKRGQVGQARYAAIADDAMQDVK